MTKIYGWRYHDFLDKVQHSGADATGNAKPVIVTILAEKLTKCKMLSHLLKNIQQIGKAFLSLKGIQDIGKALSSESKVPKKIVELITQGIWKLPKHSHFFKFA